MNEKAIANKICSGILKVSAEKEDANLKYKSRIKTVRNLIKEIEKKVDRHEKEQKNDSRNWGYVGDMGHVQEVLEEVTNFINN